ncbi:putative major facilitator family transporter [Hyphomonas neptunium ATCC 15444]|uniref:Major facilitator transporter n=2 Tax=Hyphomonas TaxID=85 RepID=A0A059FLV8_9PROT|nr:MULTISPECIES: MFS transporter [Hyphomonas]ABI76391.1 putative major facilitator family transporter [Hyphomonas neptunium ATCC 15444]KCZ91458.1 major facilitator transporter [Hyphomonas hirschiana VP5]
MAVTQSGKPGLFTRVSFGIGGAADGIKNNGFDYALLFFYSNIMGVDAGLVGLALLIALIVDAVSDPVVGYWSDNMRTRFGRRHPFMYAALIPTAVTYFLTWNPPAGMDGNDLFPWLVATTILVRLSFTFYDVPSSALSAELTSDYDERTSLMSLRYFFGWFGGLTIQILLFRFLLVPTEEIPVGVFNIEGWKTYGFISAICIFLAVAICAGGTHSHIPNLKAAPPARNLTIGRIFAEIFETISNPSFRALFIATLCGLIATGISATLNQYINTIFWEFDNTQIANLTMGVYISAVLALIIAPLVGKTFGKKRGAMTIGALAFTIAPLPVFLRLFGLLPPNGSDELFLIVISITIFDLSLIIATQMLLGSMVADIVEDSELQTGRRSEGIFFAGISFIRKLSQGAGVITASMVLAVAGLSQGGGVEAATQDEIRMLGWGYGLSLITAWTLMLICISFYRISRESHADNLEKLKVRQAQQDAG